MYMLWKKLGQNRRAVEMHGVEVVKITRVKSEWRISTTEGHSVSLDEMGAICGAVRHMIDVSPKLQIRQKAA